VPKLTVIEHNIELAKLDLSADDVIVSSRTAGRHGRDPRWVFVSPNAKALYALKVSSLSRDALQVKLSEIKAVVGYDVKTTLKTFIDLGIKVLPPVEYDVLIGAFLINSLRREQTLTELAQADLGYDGSPFEDLPDDDLLQRCCEISAVVGPHGIRRYQARY
jgi:DNA polymerase I-like protein with 3'-5' exonuclease and polymerase domains